MDPYRQPSTDHQHTFERRAASLLGSAALHQLVADMALSLDGLRHDMAEVKGLLANILAKLNAPLG